MKALLERISSATGIRVTADPHYAREIMIGVGTEAAARDLLAAVALGVAGTYRRVGDGFVLTNDLEGMAAHQARLAAWEDALSKGVDTLEGQWRKEIVESGGFRRIGFRGPAYEALTDAERGNLEANDRPDVQTGYISTATASPAIRNAVRGYHHGNDIDRERFGLASSIRYEIVLPDGSTT